ncbi:hypothetical protein AGLY_001515 [Aphis glycines]|uniref:Uncharacterized protein n=1 Tax=Aphis glycines TaxID=307491 RepID=A0A6G0U7Y9_APHGL|nr:hypothetical protein AGLY_001515 [Aphis glycines]
MVVTCNSAKNESLVEMLENLIQDSAKNIIYSLNKVYGYMYTELLLNGWTDLNEFFCMRLVDSLDGLDAQISPANGDAVIKIEPLICIYVHNSKSISTSTSNLHHYGCSHRARYNTEQAHISEKWTVTFALKWNGAFKGMCCLNEKIKLEEICPPPGLLNSLLMAIILNMDTLNTKVRLLYQPNKKPRDSTLLLLIHRSKKKIDITLKLKDRYWFLSNRFQVKSRVINVTYDKGVERFNALLTKILRIDTETYIVYRKL